MGRDRRPPLAAVLTGDIAQVVPDIPTFAVDAGFSYQVPPALRVEVGTVVRVPLSGRIVRGYVTSLRSGNVDSLRAIKQVSSELPAFHAKLLDTLRWAAIHYVGPLSVMLKKALPPNLPKPVRVPVLDEVPLGLPASALAEVTAAAAAGRHLRLHHLMGGDREDLVGMLSPVLAAERSALVVTATVDEARATTEFLTEVWGNRVIEGGSHLEPKMQTRHWSRAAGVGGVCVVGTRECALWPIRRLSVAVVADDGRRGLKDKQTPTLHARDILRRRASIERFPLVTTGGVPTMEVLAAGAAVRRTGRTTRVWPLVEVRDRSEDPPGSGLFASATVAAIRQSRARDDRVFVFTHRRNPAQRCDRCRAVRRCPVCDGAAFVGTACARCGAVSEACRACGGQQFEALGAAVPRIVEALSRLLPGELVATVGEEGGVRVGSERDLPAVTGVGLAVVVDADGLIHAPHYRAREDALRLMARVAATVSRGRGHRCIVQTAAPSDPVIEALTHGDPLKFLQGEQEERAVSGLPPVGEVVIVETRGEGSEGVELREVLGGRVDVFGPAAVGNGRRWMLQGTELRDARIELRRVVQGWRDRGVRVRIDADPIDL